MASHVSKTTIQQSYCDWIKYPILWFYLVFLTHHLTSFTLRSWLNYNFDSSVYSTYSVIGHILFYLHVQAENSTLRGELESNQRITDSKLNQAINLKEMRKRLKELSHAVKTGKVLQYLIFHRGETVHILHNLYKFFLHDSVIIAKISFMIWTLKSY